ncbi:PASTA domain-containing protein [Bifidobacterium sp. ESL0800]|uniref:PASTA domain-containing protein n=1 Tax=Bifidobacterium sp. ESL0800 TaxID=2983236 RepID=UPI0023F836CD|nr:PASTA domain-containing protein [Bifidobacterium sp. ESL0800]WEV75431.1 PASTA domain-containing protein [Bifidobacterium sp. ESL0800]
MRFCTNCGNKLDDNAQFCTACGTAQPATHDTANNGGNGLANNSGTFAGRTPSASGITPAIPLPGSGVNGTPSAPVPAPATAPVPTPTSAPAAAPMPTPAATTAQPAPVYSNSSATSPAPAPAANAGAGTEPAGTAIAGAASATTTAVRQHTKKRLVIIIAAIVAAILVVTGAGFGTYKAELWGGKTVPAPASLGIAKSKKTHEFTAADVEQSLHAKGFKTTVTETFSAKPKGSFINYRGIQSGKRYSTGNNPITILSSNGPGVPKGTSGQPVQNVTENLESMGVSVHYYSIVVSDHGPKEGTVVASYPADGQPVRDTKTGIEVGVAKRHGGIGYDVLGMTKDKAKSQYEKAGFDVTVRPRFSSKKMLGKIVDSQPKPGTASTTTNNLTLYYGIDASGFDDAVEAKNIFADDNSTGSGEPSFPDGALASSAAPAGGTYCTKAGKCINLEQTPDVNGAGMDLTTSESDPLIPDDTPRNAGDDNLIFCDAQQQPYCSKSSEHYSLYGQGTGAFELSPTTDQYAYMCGTEVEYNSGSPQPSCVNGSASGRPGGPMSGASYKMGILYDYFPVGSNVKKVVDSGYFDKAEVAKAKKQKAVDISRPFFIRRDSSLYDKTSASFSDLSDPNPFTPAFGTTKKTMKPVKPAPSDETAYYLVDQPQLDWSQLPEFTITKASKSDKKSGHKSNPKVKTKPAKDATPDEITAAVGKGDFSPIAGKYCKTDGSCLQLDKKGTVTGIPSDWKDQSTSQLHLAGPKEEWGDDARNSVPNSPYLSLIGPDSDYKCPAGTGEELCYNSGAIEADIQKPIYMMYVFKNVDTSFWYNGNNSYPSPGFAVGDDPDQPPAKDKPYLSFLSYHMNDSPRDHDVYYLTK